MTLSNFNWTDKDSNRWFILLPTGHEGPFSLTKISELSKKKRFAPGIKIWAEGLNQPIDLADALSRSETIPEVEVPILEEQLDDEGPPPIDHLIGEKVTPPQKSRTLLYAIGLSLIFLGSVSYFIGSQEQFQFHRLPKMSIDLFERIRSENTFSGWSKELFLKEYTPEDHSLIWLVSSSYQTCKIEATFSSIKDRLLSMEEDKIVFRTGGLLKNHIVEFSSFDFEIGSRIVPGLYEMDLKATDCAWDGFLPQLMNRFRDPGSDYVARMKVILFSKGAIEFNRNLDNLLNQKREREEREKNQEMFFWQDLQQKLHTLEAMTLQIEQHFVDFIESQGSFKNRLEEMIEIYAKKYGSFLSSFVLENEKFFKAYDSSGISKKREYELVIRLMSKKIGLESMKFIEQLQALKNDPNKKEIQMLSKKLKSTFQKIKTELNGKLSEVEKDLESQP